jgi:hypothetical protein
VQARHLVVDDGHADRVLAAGNVAVNHAEASSVAECAASFCEPGECGRIR